MNEQLSRLLIPPEASIRDALTALDRGGCEIAVVVDSGGHLRGVVTDGDIRRALLAGRDLDDPVAPHMSDHPHVVSPEAGRTEVLDVMSALVIEQIPVVDGDRRFVGLHIIRELLGAVERPNWAVVMAGGRGRRLAPITDHVPKPMLPVAGRPILERIVLHLVGAGIRRVLLAVNYKAEMIEEHFGDGERFGCGIDYLREDPDQPLGTGGPLALVRDLDEQPTHPLVVMNGDLVTQFPVGEMLAHHEAEGAMATVAVKEHRHEVPFGVLDLADDGRVEGIVEKPVHSWPVNGGIYVLDPGLLERVPTGREFPMTDLIESCVERSEKVAAWVMRDDDWYDVGRMDDLRKARGDA